MIENDNQLQQACEALGDMYRVLASYRAKVLPVNPRNYAVLAQGPLEEIRKIQSDINDYLGLRIVSDLGQTPGGQVAVLREEPE